MLGKTPKTVRKTANPNHSAATVTATDPKMKSIAQRTAKKKQTAATEPAKVVKAHSTAPLIVRAAARFAAMATAVQTKPRSTVRATANRAMSVFKKPAHLSITSVSITLTAQI